MVRLISLIEEEENMHGFMEKLEVGATVYYKAPRPAYAVRKSTVVEVIEHPFRRCGPALPHYEYVLANGERLRCRDAYASREAAEAAIIEDLKSRLAWNQVSLANLQHEMARQEEALQRLEKHHTEEKTIGKDSTD